MQLYRVLWALSGLCMTVNARPSILEKHVKPRADIQESQALQQAAQQLKADAPTMELYMQLLGSSGSSNLSDSPGRQLSTLKHNGQSFSFQYGADTWDFAGGECALAWQINIGSWTFSDNTIKDDVTMHDVLRDVVNVRNASPGRTGVDILEDQIIVNLDAAIDDFQSFYSDEVCLFGSTPMTTEIDTLTNGMRTLNQVEGNHWTVSISSAIGAGIVVWGAQEIAHAHPEFRQAANAIAGFGPAAAAALIFWVGRRPRTPQPIRDADVVLAAATAATLRRSSRGIRYGPRACLSAVASFFSQCVSNGGTDTGPGLVPANPQDMPAIGGGQYCIPNADIEMGALNVGNAAVQNWGVVSAADAAAQMAQDNAQQFCDIYAT